MKTDQPISAGRIDLNLSKKKIICWLVMLYNSERQNTVDWEIKHKTNFEIKDYYIILFTNPSTRAEYDTSVVLQVLIQSFPSPSLVA